MDTVTKVLRSLAFENVPPFGFEFSKYPRIIDYGYFDECYLWHWRREKDISIDDLLYIIKLLREKDVYEMAVKISKFKEENVQHNVSKEEEINCIKDKFLDELSEIKDSDILNDVGKIDPENYFKIIAHFLTKYGYTVGLIDASECSCNRYMNIKRNGTLTIIKISYNIIDLQKVLFVVNNLCDSDESCLIMMIKHFIYILNKNLNCVI